MLKSPSSQPAHLVDHLVRIQRLAVGDVCGNHPHRAAGGVVGGRHDALLLVGKAGDVLDHVAPLGQRGLARQDGHAVVGFLAREQGGITSGIELGQRVAVIR
jgi:hypothetical protein